MTIETEVDHSRRLTTFTADGETSAREIIQALESFYQTYPTQYALWDLRRAISMVFSPDQARQFSDITRVYGNRREESRTAIVIMQEQGWEMLKIIQENPKYPIDTMIFNTLVEAQKWLYESE